ncbi:MAG: hypothetical protein K5894_16380 [Lachnospiraceae bacterium]|nr:hypothetical protein [Lachnospiraceae bacterium]
MIIAHPNLNFYWHNPNRGLCGQLENLPEIEHKKYGYNLLGGQKVYFIGYIIGGAPYAYDVNIIKADEGGVTITNWGWDENSRNVSGDPIKNCFADFMQEDGTALLPWYTTDKKTGENVALDIQPCEILKDKLTMRDLLSGSKEYYTDRYGTGIWWCHGGWRYRVSRYDENLRNFTKLGQLTLEDVVKGS